jgi:hypothetical protein
MLVGSDKLLNASVLDAALAFFLVTIVVAGIGHGDAGMVGHLHDCFHGRTGLGSLFCLGSFGRPAFILFCLEVAAESGADVAVESMHDEVGDTAHEIIYSGRYLSGGGGTKASATGLEEELIPRAVERRGSRHRRVAHFGIVRKLKEGTVQLPGFPRVAELAKVESRYTSG